MKKNHPLIGNLMSKIEDIFFFLISAAEEHLDDKKIDRILESPNRSGLTVFNVVSCLSDKISIWILYRNIDVAFVFYQGSTPIFKFESNVEKMLEKGINPFVVRCDGKSEYDNLKNIEIDQKLLLPFITGMKETAAFYSFRDSLCSEKCEKSCEDKMRKFKLYTGKRNFKTFKKEGLDTFRTWHRAPAAFKLLPLGKFGFTLFDEFENTQAEFEILSNLSHPNILKVFHYFLYQETKIFAESRCQKNLAVIVMDLHEKNIGELTSEERISLPDLLQDVLGKVLILY